jgi:polysaccharide export outer membrane protein
MTLTPQTNSRAHATLSSTLVALGLSLCLCFVFSSSSVVAQSSATPAVAAQEPALQRHPLGIEDAQPDAHEEYTLGGGDEIVVSVAGRPELSGTHIVGPDGRITLPVVGTVAVGDKSRDEAARSIDETIGKNYSGTISSTVEVTKYGSNHITLLGAIEKPGVITFDQPPSLLEVLARGGAVLNPDKSVQTARKCVIYRGDNQVMNVNISERFDGRRALNDIRLRRNDIVYIPDNQQSLISVLGEVTKPGPVRLDQNSTLVSLLASAGGITEKAGNPIIQIVEPSTGKVQTIKFKELLTLHGGSDVTLHDGDIIYVPRSGLAKFGYTVQQVAPIAGIATVFSIAH